MSGSRVAATRAGSWTAFLTWAGGCAVPPRARLADLHRGKAWPFLAWCFVHRHLEPDLELLLAKPGGAGLPAGWAEHEPDNLAAVAEAAAVLGWSRNWQRQVGLLAASTICLFTGKPVRQLTEDDFAAVLGQLDALAAVSASSRHHTRTRLFALQQACYQLGSLTTPPRQSGPVAERRWSTPKPSASR